MRLIYYGHSCFGIESDETKLLIDPYITPNPLASKIKLETIHPNLILVSHAHDDHIHDAPTISQQSGAPIASNFEITGYLQKCGLPVIRMNHGGHHHIGDIAITYVNAVHTSTFVDGNNGGQPGGWIIQSGKKTIYFAGDTDLMADMQLFGMRWKIDIALLPIGGRYTMSYREIPLACNMLGCKTVIGMHYDTFDPIRIDHHRAEKYCADHGMKLVLLEVGGALSDAT